MVNQEAEQLWRRIGLEELRQAIKKTRQTMDDFERTVEALPDCEHCARAAILQEVGHSSAALERSVIGVNLLASVLQETVAAVDKAKQTTAGRPVTACRCPAGPCQCQEDPDA